MTNSVLLRFASEEMVYLLRALHITAFPGLDPEPLKELAESEKSLLMMAADHALRARGLIRWRGETEREVDPFLAKVLFACSQPSSTLFLDLSGTKLLHIFGQEILVEQCEPEPGVQQYLVMTSREAYLARLQGLLVQKQGYEAPDLPGARIRPDLWLEALNVARVDEARASTLLASALPPQTVGPVLAALRDASQIQYLALWKQPPGSGQSSPDAALTIVAGSQEYILLWLEEPWLKIVPAGSEQVWAYVTRLLPPVDQDTSLA